MSRLWYARSGSSTKCSTVYCNSFLVSLFDLQYNLTMRNTKSCLASQLTDEARVRLTNFFNEYRRNFSMGQSIYLQKNNMMQFNNIFKLVSFGGQITFEGVPQLSTNRTYRYIDFSDNYLHARLSSR